MTENINEEQLRQIENLKKHVLRTILSKDAYERISRVKIANPQLAAQVEMYLLQLYQADKIRDILKDEQMKEILKALTSNKKEFNIKFR